MKTAAFLLVLLLVRVRADSATLCGAQVSLSSSWGSQGETFNVSLLIQNLTRPTNFSLAPLWDKLVISQTQFPFYSSSAESEFTVQMQADQFYLYNVNISCDDNLHPESALFEVPVKRTNTSSTIALVFQRIMAVCLAFAMLLMGCELDREVVKSYLLRPLAPAAGMACQYLFMPVMAYLVGLILLSDRLVMARYGLILVGSSPGGSFSNFWTALWGGDLDLSVTMTFCSTVVSFGTTTFWVWLFGKFVLESQKNLSLPYIQLLISLVSLIVPIFIGMFITYKRPDWSKKLVKLSRPFFILMMVVVSTLGIYINRFFFTVVSWYDLVAPACLGLSGYTVGILVSVILGLNRKQVIALSLETAIQNAGIAIMILQTNLPSPYGDMALLPVIGYLFTSSGLLNIVLYLLFKLIMLAKSSIDKPSQEQLGLNQKVNKGYVSE